MKPLYSIPTYSNANKQALRVAREQLPVICDGLTTTVHSYDYCYPSNLRQHKG